LALSRAGKTGKAAQVLSQIHQIYVSDIIILMGLIENSLRAGDQPGFDRYANRLLAGFSIGEVRRFLLQVEEGEIEVPLTPEILTPALGNKLRQKLIKTG
ncbi:MAG: hypothetical protein P8X85_13765, partial [Desulfobacterales bacterium]